MHAHGEWYVYPTGFSGVDNDCLKLNLAVAQLIHYGMSNVAIAEKLGITHSQVQSRVSLYGLQWQRRRFRNGQTPEAQTMISSALRISGVRKSALVAKCGVAREGVLKAARAKRAQGPIPSSPKKDLVRYSQRHG